MAKAGDMSGYAFARRVLENEKNPKWVTPSLELIGLAGRSEDLSLLDRLKAQDPPAVQVRQGIAQAEFLIRSKGLTDDQKVDRYEELLERGGRHAQHWAVKQLGKIGNRRANESLRKHLERKGTPGGQATIANELRKKGFRIRRTNDGKFRAE
jgi:hypothetical protein